MQQKKKLKNCLSNNNYNKGIMSDSKKEPLEVKVMDPIETMVRSWVTNFVVDPVQAELGDKVTGISLPFKDLTELILNCFDDVQKTMLESIIPPNTTIH